MRVAYIGRWTTEASDGVRAKVEAHADEWRRRGCEVRLFRLAPVGYTRSGRTLPWAVAASVAATARLRHAVEGYAPDIIYVRYGLFIPSLTRLQRRFASVVEVNANDQVEAAVRGRRALNALSRRSLLGHAAGIVCVSRELARDVAPPGKPTRVIANGSRLDIVPAPPPRRSGRPLAVYVIGVPMPKHGLDKLVTLAGAIPECDFAVIGAEPSALPDALGNVSVHPATGGDAYGEFLARADVGIGPLAMHRAGMHEGSPLKVRDYLAHGLPVVIAYEDTDFADVDPWFLLRVPNTEDNIRRGAEDVRRFINQVRGRRVGREEIADRIGAEAKERVRLAFMAKVAAR